MSADDQELKSYTYRSGAVYEGTFSGTKRHGRGHWKHPEGEIYEGEYVDNKQEGLGLYIFGSTGKRYVGHWRGGMMDGRGVYFFTADDSVFFHGGYEKDLKHGNGYYMYDQGVLTSQTWDKGVMVSEVEATPVQRVECQVSIDNLLDSVRRVAPREMGEIPSSSEPRTFQFPSGATYTGQYLGTKKHGQGYWVHPEGDSYEGQFNMNKHCGWGVYIIGRSGKKFVGHWSGGKMSGVGVYFFNPQETEYFMGAYKSDVKDGRGLYHFAETGKCKVQSWDKGELKSETDADEETVEQYMQAIRAVMKVVRAYTPHYEPIAFP